MVDLTRVAEGHLRSIPRERRLWAQSAGSYSWWLEWVVSWECDADSECGAFVRGSCLGTQEGFRKKDQGRNAECGCIVRANRWRLEPKDLTGPPIVQFLQDIAHALLDRWQLPILPYHASALSPSNATSMKSTAPTFLNSLLARRTCKDNLSLNIIPRRKVEHGTSAVRYRCHC